MERCAYCRANGHMFSEGHTSDNCRQKELDEKRRRRKEDERSRADEIKRRQRELQAQAKQDAEDEVAKEEQKRRRKALQAQEEAAELQLQTAKEIAKDAKRQREKRAQEEKREKEKAARRKERASEAASTLHEWRVNFERLKLQSERDPLRASMCLLLLMYGVKRSRIESEDFDRADRDDYINLIASMDDQVEVLSASSAEWKVAEEWLELELERQQLITLAQSTPSYEEALEAHREVESRRCLVREYLGFGPPPDHWEKASISLPFELAEVSDLGKRAWAELCALGDVPVVGAPELPVEPDAPQCKWPSEQDAKVVSIALALLVVIACLAVVWMQPSGPNQKLLWNLVINLGVFNLLVVGVVVALSSRNGRAYRASMAEYSHALQDYEVRMSHFRKQLEDHERSNQLVERRRFLQGVVVACHRTLKRALRQANDEEIKAADVLQRVRSLHEFRRDPEREGRLSQFEKARPDIEDIVCSELVVKFWIA